MYITLEQPGVNAPGTANMTAFLLASNSDRFTLFPGVFSKSSTEGIESPIWKIQQNNR